MMISRAILVLALAASGLSLPLTTQEQVSTESERVPQFPKQGSVAKVPEKTEIEGSPEETTIEQVQPCSPVRKIENMPVKVDKPRDSIPENPVLLPVQPLTVLPVEQAGSVLRPVVVPVEVITPESFIKVGIPIQQGGYNEEIIMIDAYTPLRTLEVESQESHSIQRKDEKVVPTESPVQVQSNSEPLNREQVGQVDTMPEKVEKKPVSVEQKAQVDSVPKSVQSDAVQNAEKNVPNKAEEGYVPVQIPVQQPVRQVEEKQGSPVGSQEGELGNRDWPDSGKPVVNENVEKQVPEQKSSEKQREDNVQKTEKQGEYQQVNPDKPEKRPVSQQTYKAESGVEKEGEKKQVSPDTPVQKEPVVQETYIMQPVVEKQGQLTEPQEVQTGQQEVETQEYKVSDTCVGQGVC